LFYGRVANTNPDNLERLRLGNIEKLRTKQAKDLQYHNKKRKPIKQYSPGDISYVKRNKIIGSKLSARYQQEVVKENKNSTIITQSGRIVHKINIRN